ncbi:prepilin-type N-terminal cleavage/methylation domain-containing protein [Candidatus Microgenomates bacterium]|nr:MAG: prepilin-type N-terminal cleavage/methylation domain-containing protein [Candidatus Microgenomates bacterium]
MINHKKGFTLIELLIVIGILGILAVGLLAALDPIEQLRRGRDSNRKRVATEYQQAIVRYNAVTGTYPWGTGTPPNTTLSGWSSVTTTLIGASELKSSFTSASSAYASGTNGITITYDATTSEVVACFLPESKGEKANYATLYANVTGTAVCGGATSTCYYCIR